jgi:hypothetical protein
VSLAGVRPAFFKPRLFGGRRPFQDTPAGICPASVLLDAVGEGGCQSLIHERMAGVVRAEGY